MIMKQLAVLVTLVESAKNREEQIASRLEAINSEAKAEQTSVVRRLMELEAVIKKGAQGGVTPADVIRLEAMLQVKFDALINAIHNQPPAPKPLLVKNRVRAAANFNQGVAEFRAGRSIQALQLFALSLDDNPTDARVWYYQAIVDLSLNDEVAAESSLREVATLIGDERAKYDEICRALHRVQGSLRNRAERMLLSVRPDRTGVASRP